MTQESEPVGIAVAALVGMIGRSRSELRVTVMGPILFPVTIPVRVAQASEECTSPSRIAREEEFLMRPSPRLPRHDGLEAPAVFGGTSLLFHATILAALLALAGIRGSGAPDIDSRQAVRTRLEMPRLVFLMEPARPGPGGGGGGGGNRQTKPVPRAEARGRDSLTRPVAQPIAPDPQPRDEASPPQAVALDATPLASALAFQVGSLDGPPALGTSQGPGSGGGVGEGTGTGIGSGRGPGFGPGSGGGTGGGVYRPGNDVESPRLLRSARPNYTAEAMRAKVQGVVRLEGVVMSDGTVGDVRVTRSLDSIFGLDQEAMKAAKQFRFVPGMRFGEPVAVMVSFEIEFALR